MNRFIIATLLLAAVALVLRLRTRQGGSGRLLKITARAAVGRGTSMVVVEVEGRRLLVGAAANQMSVLAELSGATTGDAESQEPEPSAIPPRPGLSGVGVSGVAFDSLLSARDTGDSSSLVDRVRSMTIRTLDPNLRRRPGTPRLRIGRER